MHGSVYSRADVQAILTLAVDCIKEQLLDGNKVSLGELGAFSVGLKSKGTKTNEEFGPEKIESVHVNFTPGKMLTNLLKEASFQKVSTRIAQAAILDSESNGNKSVDLAAIKAAEAAKRKKK